MTKRVQPLLVAGLLVVAVTAASLAIGVARVPGLRRPALVSTAVSSAAWLAASVVWWRRRLPNSWGPPATAALPIANAATVLVIASRFARALRLDHPDDLEVPR